MTGTQEPRSAAAPNEPPSEGSSGPQSPSAPAGGAQAVETPTNAAEGRTAARDYDADADDTQAITARRQPGYDAVFAYIRSLDDHMPPDPAHRNALIWRGVAVALDALQVGCCISSHCVEGDHVLIVGQPIDCVHTEDHVGECPCSSKCGCCTVTAATPAPAELRQQYAAAIHRALRDYGEGDYDPGTGSDYGDQAAVVLAVRDPELQQLRDQLAEARTALRIAEGDRDAAEGHARRLLAQRQEMADERYAWQERGDRAEAAIARVHAELIDLCREPHPSHDHLCPDDVRRVILNALDQPHADQPQEPS